MASNWPQVLIKADVRFGSLADILRCGSDVCLTPKADIDCDMVRIMKPVTIASVRGVRQLRVYCNGKREGDWACHHHGELPIEQFSAE